MPRFAILMPPFAASGILGNMTLSVELLLDARSEEAVREEWIALEARGFSSLAAHVSESNRPHISVFSSAVSIDTGLLSGADIAVPFEIRLGSPVLFGSGPRRVLARSVIPSLPMLELHTAVHRQLGPRAMTMSPGDSQLVPGSWMPHVTLARRLRLASLAEALELIGGDIHGQVVGVRRWDSESRTVTMLAGTGE